MLDNLGAFQRWFGHQPNTKAATLIFGLLHGFGLATKIQQYHGEPCNGPTGYYHSYSKAKQIKADKGEFTAIFDGTHGWFWRNRSNSDVTITLKTKGEYLSIKRVI